MAALFPDFSHELKLYQHGYSLIAGVDEAGRGAWAGPVVAAAVIFPLENTTKIQTKLHGLNDSKKMTPKRRDLLYDLIGETALSVGVGVGSHGCIDRHRIIAATRQAMTQGVRRLQPQPTYLLIDALPLPDLALPQHAFYKADATSLSVAAASVVAKVFRDRLMVRLAAQYPGYGFERHKGYGTRRHRESIARLGPCAIHRLSFAPFRQPPLL